MSVLERIGFWSGVTAPRWLHSAIARRNTFIMSFGTIAVILLALMLQFFVFSGDVSSLEGFEENTRRDPASLQRFRITCIAALAIMIALFIYSILYLRKKWDHPHLNIILTVVFAFCLVMLWGIAEAGAIPERQVLIFGSLQFLVASLMVLTPVISLVYFSATTIMFTVMLGMYWDIAGPITKDLIYLCVLEIVVSWIVYGLFARATISERRVADMSRRDELTGAKNRHYLRDDFDNCVGHDLAVMLCDIDDFKHYNDTFGHEAGDHLLREFYDALHDAFGDECTYRYGGDEFLVVAPDFGKDEFTRRAQRVIDQLAQVEMGGTNANLTFSGGYVVDCPDTQDAFRAMLRDADERLLEAKRAGKNRLIGD